MKTSYKRGFTLIELLVVIAIIGILSSVVLASLNSARKKGRDARRVADVKQIQLALELYYDANSNYPSNTTTAWGAKLVSGGFISAVPTDPLSLLGYAYEAIGSGTTCSSYHLGAKLETVGHSALNADIDYAAVASTQCTDGTWTTNDDIATSNGGFDGTAAQIYDVRP